MNEKAITHYHQHAAHFFEQYESVSAESVHSDWGTLLTKISPGSALDVGAGSGRDALWLSKLGWKVTAVEPAKNLLKIAKKHTGIGVDWVNDRLPYLDEVALLSSRYDLILLSAVWMHIPISERGEAFARLCELLAPTGILIITLRFGPTVSARPMFPVSIPDLQKLAHDHEMSLENLTDGTAEDLLNRKGINWVTVSFQHSKHNQ